jgi:Patatin-like phospholipase
LLFSFVVAIDETKIAVPEGAVLLRSYTENTFVSPSGQAESCFIWQAAMATSAAPVFFSPVLIGDKILLDGGLGHNNPTEHLISEAEKRWPNSEIGTVVSIGTGVKRGEMLAREMHKVTAGSGWRAKLHIIPVLKSLATSSETIERSVRRFFEGRRQSDCYYRFNVLEGMDMQLFDYSKMQDIRESTEKYLQKPVVQSLLDKCARRLESIEAPASTFRQPTPASDAGKTTVEAQNEESPSANDLSTFQDSDELVTCAAIWKELKPLYQLDSFSQHGEKLITLHGQSKMPRSTPLAESENTAAVGSSIVPPLGALAFNWNFVPDGSSRRRVRMHTTKSIQELDLQAKCYKLRWLILLHSKNQEWSTAGENATTSANTGTSMDDVWVNDPSSKSNHDQSTASEQSTKALGILNTGLAEMRPKDSFLGNETEQDDGILVKMSPADTKYLESSPHLLLRAEEYIIGKDKVVRHSCVEERVPLFLEESFDSRWKEIVMEKMLVVGHLEAILSFEVVFKNWFHGHVNVDLYVGGIR